MEERQPMQQQTLPSQSQLATIHQRRRAAPHHTSPRTNKRNERTSDLICASPGPGRAGSAPNERHFTGQTPDLAFFISSLAVAGSCSRGRAFAAATNTHIRPPRVRVVDAEEDATHRLLPALPPAAVRRESPPRHHRRILLETGRLAAHYLVVQGVLPDHVLRAREDLPFPRPAHHPARASRGAKLDGGGRGDTRSRRNDGDWDRAWEDDDRQPRSQSFDGRPRYRDVDRGGRRTRDYDEPRRTPMSRSYSHNDRRPSPDVGRVDPRRRSRTRTRTRTRTRSYYAGTGRSRDSDWRADSRDAGDGDVHYGHVDQMPRQRSSELAGKVNGSPHQAMSIQDVGLKNHTRDISQGEDGEFQQDISEDEDGEFAPARLDGDEIDVTRHQLSDPDINVHPSESVEEPVHKGSQLSTAVEDREAANAPLDACRKQALGEDNACSEARDEMVAPPPQSERLTGVGGFNRDKPELPTWYRLFDLNVVDTPEACEISGDPLADHSDSEPDLVGQIHQQTNYHASEIQGQDAHVGDNHMLKDGHDLIRYDLNDEAVEDAQDTHQLYNEKLLQSHGMDAHDASRIHRINEHLPLNQNADAQEHENDWTKNHHVIGEQLLVSHGINGHPVHDYQMASEPKRLPMGVYDLHSYNLKSEKMIPNDGADKHAHDNCHLKDRQMFFNQPANRQARIHNKSNKQTIPVINLDDDDDDYEEQSDIREFLESKSYQCLGPAFL